MTTATVDAPQTTETAKAPVNPDLASIFYTEPSGPAPNVEAPASPAPDSTTGPTATPPASAVSTEPAKTTPVGTEKPEGKEPVEDPEKGQRAAARRLGTEVVELKKDLSAIVEENKVLRAKLDGTYKEPAQPTPEEIAARAEFKGKETSSRAIAEGLYGAAKIQSDIYDDDSPYKTLVTAKPWLHARVARHAQPTVEAMRVLHEESFKATYGDDPAQWVTKIEAELKPRLEKEIQKQVAIPVTGEKAPSVTEVRGAGGGSQQAPKTLAEMLYGNTPPA